MMPERRFNEEEVALIFQRAAEAQHQTSQAPLASSEGMTLTELQAIGREVGISSDELASAAKAVELRPQPTSRNFLGFPIGVGLSVDLGRKMSQEEWETFVADLRETFDARGVVKQEGNLRYWANGNLQALLEPVGAGDRIRLRTVKGGAAGGIIGAVGLAALAVGAVIARSVGIDAASLGSYMLIGTAGAAAFGFSALRLPGWARLRRTQMETVAAKLPRAT
ncbi:MAG TPA: hypothetical protein VM099_06910 [Gemmatimonadaceae bacterium]|nr:hypothetical protein [Gemmatimonadaceae bacterium]